MNEKLLEIPINKILVNPDQPRVVFSKKGLDELAMSIRNSGLLYPITVEGPHEATDEIPHEFYILIDGERRLRAVKSLGHNKIKALVNDPIKITPDKRALLALVANLEREDLSPIEEARAFHRLNTELGLSVIKIARRTGFSTVTINARLQLLELEDEIQDLVSYGKLQKDRRLTEALLTVRDSEKRVKLAQSLAERGASVKAGIEACARVNEHIRSAAIPKEETPAIRISTIKAGPMSLSKYDVFEASGVVPKYELVKESAKRVCDNCSLRSVASEVVCKECPLAGFLINLTKTVNGK